MGFEGDGMQEETFSTYASSQRHIPQKHPITSILCIDDLSSLWKTRIHSGDIIHTMTRVRPPRHPKRI